MVDIFPHLGNDWVSSFMAVIGFNSQSNIFYNILNSDNFLFYIFYIGSLLGSLWIMINHKWWKARIIGPFIIMYLLLGTGITTKVDFIKIELNQQPALNSLNSKVENLTLNKLDTLKSILPKNPAKNSLRDHIRIFAPQAAAIHVFSKVQLALAESIEVKPYWQNSLSGSSPSLNIIKNSKYSSKSEYLVKSFNEICREKSAFSDKFLGYPLSEVSKSEDGRQYIQDMSLTHFTMKDVFILNENYYNFIKHTPYMEFSKLERPLAIPLSQKPTGNKLYNLALYNNYNIYQQEVTIPSYPSEQEILYNWLALSVNKSIENTINKIKKINESIEDDTKKIKDIRAVLTKQLLFFNNEKLDKENTELSYQTFKETVKRKDYTSEPLPEQTLHPVIIRFGKDKIAQTCLQYHGLLNRFMKDELENLGIIAANLNKTPNIPLSHRSSKLTEAIYHFSESNPKILLDTVERFAVPAFTQRQVKPENDHNILKALNVNSYSEVLPKVLAIFLSFILIITPIVFTLSMYYPPWCSSALIFSIVSIIYIKCVETGLYIARIILDMLGTYLSKQLLPLEKNLFYDYTLAGLQVILIFTLGFAFFSLTVRVISMPTRLNEKRELTGSLSEIQRYIQGVFNGIRHINNKNTHNTVNSQKEAYRNHTHNPHNPKSARHKEALFTNEKTKS